MQEKNEPRKVNVRQARARLTEILRAAENGETTVIVDARRNNTPVAVVVGFSRAPVAGGEHSTAA